jgi:hypothetical protein
VRCPRTGGTIDLIRIGRRRRHVWLGSQQIAREGGSLSTVPRPVSAHRVEECLAATRLLTLLLESIRPNAGALLNHGAQPVRERSDQFVCSSLRVLESIPTAYIKRQLIKRGATDVDGRTMQCMRVSNLIEYVGS